METHRVGYIGVRHHHRDPYFQIADELPVDIVAVCEPGEQTTTEDLVPMQDRPDEIQAGDATVPDVVEGAAIYQDPYKLIDEESLDVVWITYANDATPAIVEACARSGIHVISEKPIARTAEELRPAYEIANENNTYIIPTFFYRANPIVCDLREQIRDTQFGDIWSIEGRFIASQLLYRDTSHYIYDAQRSRGGVLQWVGVHWLDMMMHVLSSPVTGVFARTVPAMDTDVEAGATLQLEFKNGTIGTFQNGYYLDSRGKDTHLGIYGEDAQILTPVHHDSMMREPTTPVEIQSKREAWTAAPKRRIEYEFSYETFPAWGDYVYKFFEQSFQGIQTGKPPATGEDALRLLAVLDAAYESAASEQWVTIE